MIEKQTVHAMEAVGLDSCNPDVSLQLVSIETFNCQQNRPLKSRLPDKNG